MTFNSGVLAATAHLLTSPLFLIYFWSGNEMYSPLNFRDDILEENYKLSLIEGTIFHYRGKNEEPTFWSIVLQSLYDSFIMSFGGFLPFSLMI